MKSLILCAIIVGLVLFGTSVRALDSNGLVLLLPFDEGAGDTAGDLSGMGNDGAIKGAEWVNGKIGSALNFESGDYVEVPHSDSLSITDKITVMAWTYMNVGSSGEMAIVSKGTWAANDLPYELTEDAGGVIFWQFYDNAGRDTCSPNSPAAGEWHHITGTYDGEVFKCYIDGQLGEEWGYAGAMPENNASVTIGKRSKANDTFFTGMIDEVAIFNRALTAEEIQEAMSGIKPLAVEPMDKCACTWGSIKEQ